MHVIGRGRYARETYPESKANPAPPPPPAPSLALGAIFRPGVPTASPAFATWAEIQTEIAKADGFILIAVDSSIAPAIIQAADGVTDGQGSAVLTSYADFVGAAPGNNGDILTVDDGAVLHRFRGFVANLTVFFDCRTVTPLTYNETPGSQDIIRIETASLITTLTATIPACNVSGSLNIEADGAIIGQTGAQALFHMVSGATINLETTGRETVIDISAIDGVIGGGGALNYKFDNVSPFINTFPGLAGFFVPTPIEPLYNIVLAPLFVGFVSSGVRVRLWDEVVARINESTGAMVVSIDNPFVGSVVIPPGVFDCFGAVEFQGYANNLPSTASREVIVFDPFGVLNRPKGFKDLFVIFQTQSAGGSILLNTGPGGFTTDTLTFDDVHFAISAGATIAPIQVTAAGSFLKIFIINGCTFDSAAPLVPLLNVAGAGTVVEIHASEGFQFGSFLLATVGVGATVTLVHDDTVPDLTSANVTGAGTFTNTRVSLQQWVQPDAVTFAALPTATAVPGQEAFDTDVDSPLWFDGTKWHGPELLGETTGSAPTASVGAGGGGAGSSATLQAGSTDTAGALIFIPGAGPGAGINATVTFTVPTGRLPKSVQLTPVNGDTAAVVTRIFVSVGGGGTSFSINVDTVPLVAGTVYIWYYLVVG